MLLSALNVTRFAQCQCETCLKMAHFPEQHTMPVFRMAHVSERQARRI